VTSERAADVLVVGGGVVGGAVTLALAGRGHRVLAVTPDQAAVGAASRAAGAMLGALGEVTAETTRWSATDLDVRLTAADRYPRWLDELDELAGRRPAAGRGTFIVACAGRARDAENLAAIAAAAARHRRPAEAVAPNVVPGWHPSAAARPGGALFLPDEGWVDAQQLLEVLRAAAERLPEVEVRDGGVAELLVEGDRVVGARTTTGEAIPAGAVVLCAGAFTQRLIETVPGLADLLPRIVPGKGVGIILRQPAARPASATRETVLRTPNREFACGLHLVPRSGGALYLGATNRIASHLDYVGDATAGELGLLLRDAVEQLDPSLGDWADGGARVGYRPVSSDGRPLVGRTDVGGLLVATGTYRNGVLLAPLLAELVADEVGDQTAAAGTNPYSARGRAPSPPPALEVLRAGLPDLAEWLTAADRPDDLAEDLRNLLSALFEGILDPTGSGREVRTILEQSLHDVPIPEILPELIADLCFLGRTGVSPRRPDPGSAVTRS
jgi:glycine oxidase